MAKKVKQKKKSTASIKSPKNWAIVLFFKDERGRFFLGGLLTLTTLYLTLAFLSFFFTGGNDQSKLSISMFELFKSADITVQNWTGKLGAYLANLFINEGVGIAAFFPVAFVFVTGMRLWSIKLVSLKKAFIWCISGSIWFSLAFGFFFVQGYEDSFLFLGGAHGYYVSTWLNAAFGKFGTFAIILLTFIGFFIYAFDNGVQMLKALPKKLFRTKINLKEDIDDLSFETAANETDTISDNNNVSETSTIVNNNGEEPLPEAEPMEVDLLPKEDELTIEIEPPMADELPVEMASETATVQNNQAETKPEDNFELEVKEVVEEEQVKATTKTSDLEDYDPTLELSRYQFPSLDLLEDHRSEIQVTQEELISNKNRIVETLENYGIKITNIKATIGPTVTLYEIIPAAGVRIAKIKNLEDDIALSLAALGIRIIAPIPGKGTIGIEVPNQKPEIVSMRSIISSKKFQEAKYELPVALGKTITNETFCFDMAKMPHLLVAGATGQGKSVGLNAIITSLLYKKHPSQLKFVMIDPKKVELSIYSKIEKHFLAMLPDEEEPIITDVQKVVQTLNSLCIEMDNRYDLLKKAHARNIKEYNAKFIKRRLNPENGHKYLPYIVVLIDEFADLIMTAGKEVELPIARIAQLARAIGIHMIIATQRPSTNIITGVIKANFPARIGFKVSSMIDSRTILDSPGANQLIGRGDLLMSIGSEMTRVQCAFVDTPEVEEIVNYIEEQPGYPRVFELPEYEAEGGGESGQFDSSQKDALFEEAAKVVVSNQSGSTSSLQRRFSIGYNRAGRLMDQLESAGIVGPAEGSKARQVLIVDDYSLEQHLNNL